MLNDKRDPSPPTPSHGPPPEGLGLEEEQEEEFEIEIRTQKGSSIKVETASYDKLDDLINKHLVLTKDYQKKNLETQMINNNINKP